MRNTLKRLVQTHNSIGNNYICDEDRIKYYCRIPNILTVLVANGLLSHWARTLYLVMKQTASDRGSCWKSTETLARECGFSTGKVSEAKLELSKPFKELNGKPLIVVHAGNRGLHHSDTIVIVDIWDENLAYFENLNDLESTPKVKPRSRHEGAGSRREGGLLGAPSQCEGNNNPLSKKNPLKKSSSSKVPSKSLRSEEEDFSVYECLKTLELSKSDMRRLTRTFEEPDVQRAIKIASRIKVRATLMGLILNILQNPNNYHDDTPATNLNEHQRLALQHNRLIEQYNPTAAKTNLELIPKETFKLYDIFGALVTITLKSSAYIGNTQSDIQTSTEFIEANL